MSRYLGSLVESLSSGVLAIDLNGCITIFNRALAKMLGVPAEDAVGKHYLEVMTSDRRLAGALETLSSGPEIRNVERSLPGGARVLCRTAWVVDSLGERIGVMEVLEDITVIRELEQRVQQHKTLAALGEMASAVAHELRNPLAGIGGFAAMLQQELAGDERLGKMADRIVKGVENLDKVASNLLFLTKNATLRPEPFDLCQAILDAASLLDAEVENRRLRATIRTTLPRERIAVWMDPIMGRLIIGNLGKNALQAIGDGGEVSFRLRWNLLANRVECEVGDDGVGITADDLSKLFFPFFTTKENGVGLGLALVKKAVDLHHGEIEVESTPGKGSLFRVSLPIRPAGA